MFRVLLPIGDNVDRGLDQADFVGSLPCASEEIQVTLTHALNVQDQEAPRSMQSPERVGAVIEARERLEGLGVAVDVEEISAPPSRGILDLAERIDADLLVMAARKRSPAGKILFGSVTQTVLLNTDRPVTITGGTDE